MAIDTHCHLTIRFESGEVADVLSRALGNGVRGVLLVGFCPMHYRKVRDILDSMASSASSIPALAGTIGIHPHEADKYGPDDVQAFKQQLDKPDVVAIGETGLDFFRDYADRKKQEQLFRAQVELAGETGLPLILHSRSAFERTAEILSEARLPDPPGVFHCFGYGPKELEKAVEMGFFVSFAGNLTYTRSDDLRRAAAAAPPERILVETDSPFLVPRKAKNKGLRRNEPANVLEVQSELARIRGWERDWTEKRLAENVLECFPRLRSVGGWSELAKTKNGEVAA